MSSGSLVKAHKRALIDRFATPDNTRGFMEYRPNLPATRDSGSAADANRGNGHPPVGPGSGHN